MENKKEKINIAPYIMVFPATFIMCLVVVLPILNTIYESFLNATGEFTFDNYKYFFSSVQAMESLTFTLTEALITVFLSVIIAFLLALYFRFSDSWIAKLLGKLYLLPRFIPSIVAVYAVMNIIKDGGFINRLMIALFDNNFKPGLLYSMKGIVISNLWFNIPFSAMLISAALSKVEDSYIEGAKDVGASKLEILRKMIWPLVYKDIIVAGTFILMGQVGSFTIPYLTGPNNPKMLGVLLYQQVNINLDYNKAAALSVLMFILCLGGAIVYIKSNLKQEEWRVNTRA